MPNSLRARVRLTSALLTALALLASVACKDITSLAQENPGTLSVATLYVPANAPLLVNGAIGDF